jgi:CRISPR-associated protein Cmr3
VKVWIIEPRDSLIVRDGKPFGLGAGMTATSLDFPFPSTTTGGVRTRAGLDHDGLFDTGLIDAVTEIGIRGPLLAELSPNGDVNDLLLPAPADALLMRYEDNRSKANIKRLAPIDSSPGLTNLENGLRPVGYVQSLKGKPLDNPPRFWRWAEFRQWLAEANDKVVDLNTVGHSGLEKDSRVHVSISDAFTAGDGELFQTRGLEFRSRGIDDGLSQTKRLALVVFVEDHSQAENIKRGLAPLGGERRVVGWRQDTSANADEIRHCPPEISKAIVETGYCRLVLVTPAFFSNGSLPSKLFQPHTSGVTARLRALTHGRYQVVSGWDFAKVSTKNEKKIFGEPKPTRRLMPSGAVLFLELDGDEASRRKWVEQIWFACVSDSETDNKDGFGLALLGTCDSRLFAL